MKKATRNIGEEQKEFIKIMDKLSYRFQRWEVWSDFITMFAASISNAFDKIHFEKREETYMQIINKYNKQEQELFPQLCGIVVMAMESDADRDFLGELYMAMELSNHWKGQFFTPYNVCKMMARMNNSNTAAEIEEKGYISVADPACGAGAMLIAYANAVHENLKDSNYNWQHRILFAAQDIDAVVGKMCYIQLSLLGCAGYVKIADSLLNPMTDSEAVSELSRLESSYWYTPMYFSDVWHYRRLFHMTDCLYEKKADNEKKPEKKEKTVINAKDTHKAASECELNIDKNGQILLF